jgi:hypothetical protein
LPIATPHLDRRCPVFGSLGNYISHYEANMQEPVTIPGMQVSAAIVMVLEAVRGAPNVDTQVIELRQWITEYVQKGQIDSFWGSCRFGQSGQRVSARPSSRQAVKLPFEFPFARYHSYSDIVLPSAEARSACEAYRGSMPEQREAGPVLVFQSAVFNCSRMFSEGLVYPLPTWRDKSLDIYPCRSGCIYSFGCKPCHPGLVRQQAGSRCVPCEQGRFAEAPGMYQCTLCPAGATCKDPANKPRSRPGYFVAAWR